MYKYQRNIIITPYEYEILSNVIPCDSKTIHQVNYYYDSDKYEMNGMGITCYIKEIGNEYIAIVRSIDTAGQNSFKTRSKQVQNPYDKSLFEGLKVQYKGKMICERQILYQDNLIEIMLDKNIYFDTIDYELEAIYACENENLLMHLLHYFQNIVRSCLNNNSYLNIIKQSNSAKSKSQRFFLKKKYKENQNNNYLT